MSKIHNYQKQLCDIVELYLRNVLVNKGKCDYHVEGLITSKDNNLYGVKINGEISTNLRARTGMNFEIGDRVEVLVRNGDWSKKVIVDYLYW